MKISNKLIKFLSLITISALSLISTANASLEGFKFTVVNHTDFDVEVQGIESVAAGIPFGVNPLSAEAINAYTTSTQSMERIDSGNTVTKDMAGFAAGINKIQWQWYKNKDAAGWEYSKDYNQTKAKILFFNEDGQKVTEPQPIEISQEIKGKNQPFTFQYKGKDVKINVIVTSKENLWEAVTRWGRNEMYYDYTVTLTQEEPARGTLK